MTGRLHELGPPRRFDKTQFLISGRRVITIDFEIAKNSEDSETMKGEAGVRDSAVR